MSSAEPLIGFMVLYEDPSKRLFVEAILITDKNGYPIEYRFTEKITISETQQFLYGKTLRPYLVLEVFGLKLIKKLSKMPTLILAKDEELLALREKIDVPILYVKANISAAVSNEVSFKTHQKYPDDIDRTRNILESCKEQISVNELFERIFRVLQKLE